MTPVFQRNIHKGEGDCMPACIASITGIPLEEIPNPNIKPNDEYTLIEFLKERGYCYLQIYCNKHLYSTVGGHYLFKSGEYCIISVPSQRFEGVTHAVVAQFNGYKTEEGNDCYNLEIVHDPNPHNKKYEQDIVDNIHFIYFIFRTSNPKSVL